MSKIQSKKSRFWKRVGLSVLILFCLGVASGLIGGYHLYKVYSRGLPTDEELFNRKPDEATRIYDRTGILLYEVYDAEKRVSVAPEEISSDLKQATIAIEDVRFYDHPGIDPKGIARAVVRNAKAGAQIEGASTITQQLVKNAYLDSKRTLDRKVKEMLIAIRLERRYSKDQVLAMYLNEVGYGSNLYGAEMAAQTYFGKSAKDISLAEAATLAALTKAPGELTPYGNRVDDLTVRRNIVLEKMAEQGMITADDAKEAQSVAIAVQPRSEKINAPHFVMYIKEKLVEQFGKELVEKGGLEVTTSLDLSIQKLAEDVVQQSIPNIEQRGASNAALVALDPTDGEILAMVGSRDYFDRSRDGNVNVTTSTRPPGSAFKPLVYAAGLEKGWAPASVLFDVETNFGEERIPYIPKNYNGKFNGPVSIRDALANSYNVPAVKMLAMVGKNEMLEKSKKFGITTLTTPERYGLSLVLGGGDVTLLELAGSYATFANKGSRAPLVGITRIRQGDKTLYEHKVSVERVVPAEVAYQITSILSDAQARSPIFGTRSPLSLPNNRPAAVKTGTTQEYRDAWTVGYTPSMVVGVWVGNNDFSPMKSGSAGAMAAAPIWNAFMTRMFAQEPIEEFKAPEGLETLVVDAVSGKLPGNGTRQTRQDMFASWQKPTNTIDLASYSVYGCNNEVLEVKSIPILHSEKPDNSNWEKPVQSWLRAHGYATGNLKDVHETCEPPIELVSEDPESAVGGDTNETSVTVVEEVELPPTPTPTPIPEPTPITEDEETESRRGRRRATPFSD